MIAFRKKVLLLINQIKAYVPVKIDRALIPRMTQRVQNHFLLV